MRMGMPRWLSRTVTAAVVLGAAVAADAGVIGSYGFSVFENSDGVSTSEIGLFRLDVFQIDADSGRFDLYNLNTTGGTKVHTVYFESGLTESIENLLFSSSNSSSGVDYGGSGGPSDPPGSNHLTPTWVTGAQFQKGSGHGLHGVGVNEHGSWTFDLKSGAAFSDVLSGLPDDGSNTGRMALHIGGVTTAGKSVSAVTINVVPLPPAAWMGLGLLGFLGLSRLRRRRRRRRLAL